MTAVARADIEGTLEYTHGYSCTTVFSTDPLYLPFSGTNAFEVDASGTTPPNGNQPFYVGVFLGSLATNCSGGTDGNGGGNALAEFIPPPGVSIVTNNSTYPIKWYVQTSSGPTPGTTPVTIKAGPDAGGYIVYPTASGPDSTCTNGSCVWEFTASQGSLVIEVPLQTTRQLSGVDASCPQLSSIDPSLLENIGLDDSQYQELSDSKLPVPCPASEANDGLQISIGMADGGDPDVLVDTVGLFATAPTSSSGGGSGSGSSGGSSGGSTGTTQPTSGGTTFALRAPASLSPGAARRGVHVALTNAPKGRLRITLRDGSAVIASWSKRTKGGSLSVTLIPGHRARLRKGAELTVTARDGSGTVSQTVSLS